MPRYFFDLYNDFDTLDEEGRDFADLSAMRENALREVREMMTESVRQGQLNLNHHIEVRDEAGKVIYVLTFDDAVNVTPAG